MIVTKLATAFAFVTTFMAGAVFSQVEANSGLQQPTAFTPVGGPVVAPVAAQANIRQPDSQSPISIPNVAAAPVAELQQPQPFSVPSTYASYYDDEEDEEMDESDDSDESDDLDCGDDLGCGDECGDDCNGICGWDCGGWIEQGYTFNGYDPRDHSNGTVVMNDRANEYQLNQLWLYMEREVDNGGCGWDHGGRIDAVFGTDARFMRMEDGLEDRWDQEDLYQFALLRFYYDVAYDDWTLRAGRWDSPVGYEPWDATESFFYSRSYNFLTQPGTLLGLMLTRHLNEQLSVSAGIHRGSDQFDDTDGKDAVDFVGGTSWESCDEETWVDAYVISEEKGIGNDSLHYSITTGTMLTERWEYVCEWYYGNSDDAAEQAEWYGLNQQAMREINDCWSYGFRFEWFRDDDGFRVFGVDPRNSAEGPFVGNFYELTFAVNYTPTESFALRPEIRWDWYKADTAGGPEPFDDGTRSNQFIASIDAIFAF